MVLYVSYASSFILTYFFALNLFGWFGVFFNKIIIFDISLLHYYNNFRSSIVFCIYSGDIYLSLGISLSWLLVTVSKLFFWWFSNFSYYIDNFITYEITSCFFCFLNCFIWTIFECICCRLCSIITKFLAVFTTLVFT